MAQGLKPSDNPVKVREFETRLLLVVFPVIYILIPGSWCPLFFVFVFVLFGNTPPTCRCFPFCFLQGTPTRHREGVEACGGVQRSHVNGLGEFLPLFCVVIFVFSSFLIFMPMEVVREFETRHPFIFVNDYCFHYGVFLFVSTTRL